MSSDDFLLDQPKIDLHLHLDGAIRTETILDLANRRAVELPADTPEALRKHVTVPADCRSLSEFLDCFETFYPVLQHPESVERIAVELCEDLVEQNVIYAETRFAPVLLTEAGASQRTMVEAALDGLRRGTGGTETTVNLILCLYRGTDPETSLETVRIAEDLRERGIVGIDIAGDESEYSAREHQAAFERANRRNLNVTVHAGEAGGAENVREGLALGADRIGHGIRAVRDEALLEELRREQIPLEICYTSNLQTGAVENPGEHPLRELYDRGVKVTINTDDPGVSRTSIGEEYRRVARQFDFTRTELMTMLENAADAAFVPRGFREDLKSTLAVTEGDENAARGE